MWQGIIGHDDVAKRFRQTLKSGRLASTYLFVGPPGIGKKQFALELAHALLCTESPESGPEPCGKCESCRMFAAGNHPDLDVVGLRPEKRELAISQFIGYDEFLDQEALCHRIALKPFFGGRRIAIIDDADHFNLYSANCLLKTLEEPPPKSLLILIGTSPSRQLPTIRSRSQVVRFNPLDVETIANLLVEAGATADRSFALRVAGLSEGSLERARQLADPALWDFRDQLFTALTPARLDSVRLARAIQAFVDEAGKEPSQKRGRLRTIIEFAIDYYRMGIREQVSAAPASSAIDASLAALEHIDRNANVGLVIQWWCESLHRARNSALPATHF
jgi:DNA polymerase-3 subunit delta'